MTTTKRKTFCDFQKSKIGWYVMKGFVRDGEREVPGSPKHTSVWMPFSFVYLPDLHGTYLASPPPPPTTEFYFTNSHHEFGGYSRKPVDGIMRRAVKILLPVSSINSSYIATKKNELTLFSSKSAWCIPIN